MNTMQREQWITAGLRGMAMVAIALQLVACTPQTSDRDQHAGVGRSPLGNRGPLAGDGATPARPGVSGALAARLLQARGASTTSNVLLASATIASAPDRGALTAPATDRRIESEGGYRWTPVEMSEAHALASISSGTMTLRAPDGRMLDLRYSRHEEHDSGDWSWIGHLAGEDPGHDDVLITFGARAAFGQIALPGMDSPPLKLTTRDGSLWIGEATFASLAKAASRQRAIGASDAIPTPPRSGFEAETIEPVRAAAAAAAAAPASKPTVDVLIGYTAGFRASFGSDNATITRLNNVVDDMNMVLGNSGVSVRVRLVATTYVTYPDIDPPAGSTRVNVALEDLTGRDGHVVPDSLKALHGPLRDKFGADLVSLMVSDKDGKGGCGVGWQIQTKDSAHEQQFGYSSLSYGCEHALKHELGHNLGLSHDHETDTGTNQLAAYGFGYRTRQPDGVGFCTTMAYQFDPNTPNAMVYSTPLRKFKGLVTGNAASADNARLLKTMFPVVAAFRATKVFDGVRARNDVDGDGYSDILLRNADTARLAYYRMSGAHVVAAPASQGYVKSDTLVASGDFDGDGRLDLIWRLADNRLRLWRFDGSTWKSALIATRPILSTTQVVGAADVDGDGRDELLFTPGNAVTYWDINLWDEPTRHADVSPPAGTKLLAAGDLNGDGRADLLWIAPSRTLRIWWSNGETFGLGRAELQLPALGPTTSVFAVGDMTGDRQAEIMLFDSQAHAFRRYTLHGDKLTPLSAAASVSASAKPLATGDFNGDGRTDVLWRSGSGQLVIWPEGDIAKSQVLDRQPTAVTLVEKGGIGSP